jgi:cysteine-S-conjugate beta-lyase
MNDRTPPDVRKETQLIHSGRDPASHHGTVNMPVYRASTICFRTMAAMEHARANPLSEISYGIHGTPTVRALEEAVATLEGGYRSLAVGSGLAAVSAAMLAFIGAGDHILVVDSVYGPTRNLCEGVVKRFGVETTYYDPAIGASIADLIRPNTRLIYAESPGSHTFEVQDIPAIAGAAKAAGIPLLHDNSWGTPHHFASFAHGVDVSIHAGTKYIVGHSDALLGLIVTNERYFQPVRNQVAALGHCGQPDDCYLGLRGLRTIGLRLKQQSENAMEVALWLRGRPEVDEVLYPALPGAPGHDIWKRDFTGAASLFSIVLKTQAKAAVDAFVDNMSLFAIGASWGGFESLVLPNNPAPLRAVRPWRRGAVVRLHIGLEHPQDLIADLAGGFDRLRQAIG